MYDLLAEYGLAAIVFLAAALTWLFLKLAALIESKTVREYAVGLFEETLSAVREVGTGYVEALKEGNADGKLTDAEKTEAKKRAIAIAKSNLGTKGLKKLARVFDVDDWIGNKVEAILSQEKRLGKPGALLELMPPSE